MKKLLSLLLALSATVSSFGSCSYVETIFNQDTTNSSQIDMNIRRLDMNKLAENIDAAAEYDFAYNKVFGSAYYVYQDGNVFEKCYGTASLNADDTLTSNSIFRLASMTKPITAIAALILVEKGFISLDDTIDMYLPSFKNIQIINASGIASKPKNLPTIRNLLNHTSGIGCDQNKLNGMTTYDKSTLDAAIAFYLRIGLDFEPGTKQQYSGYAAFDVLTKIIEIVSGTDYLSFLQNYVFAPCGMVDTTFTPNAEQKERIVAMHNRINGENTVSNMPQDCVFEDFPSTHYLGGAGLVSTLSDYSKFANMLLNKGKTEKGRILKEETFNLLCTPQVDYSLMPQNERWGLGVRVITEDVYPFLPVGSFGWSGAYGSHFWIDPVNKIFAVYMKNSRVDGGSANESARKFESAVYSSFADEE